MKKRDGKLCMWPILIVVVLFAGQLAAQSQTAFSYQGQLKKNGEAVDEPAGCDLRFTAYDTLSGGATQGTTSTHDAVGVDIGLFTVSDVDFGAGVFDGGPRWMEIEVQCPADAGWQLLSPRQPITGSPYAVHGHGPWASAGADVWFTGGSVGVGTASPGSNFDVAGTTHTGALVVNPGGTTELHFSGGNITTMGSGSMNLNGDNAHNTRINNFLHVKLDDKIGIGTATPSDTLNVIGEVVIVSGEAVDGTYGNGGLIVADSTQTTGIHFDHNDIRKVGPGSLNINSDNVNNTRINNFLHIKADSKVGIGTPAPESALHVVGAVTTDTLTIKAGSDLAESFDIDGRGAAVRPGHVVSIDPVNPGKLVLTTTSYDRTVAGVVSGAGSLDTGLVMGQTGSIADGEHAVALAGRVYVRVDATHDAVRPGDLLTTSSTPGHAMKVGDNDLAQGAILGKAMTSLEEGRGLVLTLVSLQ